MSSPWLASWYCLLVLRDPPHVRPVLGVAAATHTAIHAYVNSSQGEGQNNSRAGEVSRVAVIDAGRLREVVVASDLPRQGQRRVA